MQSENEAIVKSVYPDAKVVKFFIYNEWHPCIHSYSCGEMLDECVGWMSAPPPKNEKEAWEQAARYVNRIMLKKLSS